MRIEKIIETDFPLKVGVIPLLRAGLKMQCACGEEYSTKPIFRTHMGGERVALSKSKCPSCSYIHNVISEISIYEGNCSYQAHIWRPRRMKERK